MAGGLFLLRTHSPRDDVFTPNAAVGFGERARLGRSEPRPRGSPCGANCATRLA